MLIIAYEHVYITCVKTQSLNIIGSKKLTKTIKVMEKIELFYIQVF